MSPSRRPRVAALASLSVLLLASPALAGDLELSGQLELDKRLLLEQGAAQLAIPHEASLNLKAFPAEPLEVKVGARLRFYDTPVLQDLDGLGDPGQTLPVDLLLWDAYLDWFDVIEERLDLRLGKQRIAWGTAYRFNPTDNLNPDDLSDFLDFGAKLPSWALRADLYLIADWLKITAVWLPGLVPALLPRYGELPIAAALDSGLGEMVPASISTRIGSVGVGLPQSDLAHSMQAIKAAGNAFGVDWSLSYFHGYDDMPLESTVDVKVISPTAIQIDPSVAFAELHVIGADLAGELFSVGWWVEAAVFFPEERALVVTAPTPQGVVTDEAVILHSDPYTKLTAGLDYTLPFGLYFNLQYIHGLFNQRGGELYDYFLLATRQTFLDEALTLTFSAMLETDAFEDLDQVYGLSMSSELAYKPLDNLDLAIGHVVLGGAGKAMFATMPDGDQTYARLRVSF